MNLHFMDRSLSDNHRKAGLYIEQTGDIIELKRDGKMLPIAQFDSRASCQSVIDRADQYLGEITAGITFEQGSK